MDITATNLSADSIHAFIKAREQEKAEERRKLDESARAEREKLHKNFLTGDIPKDAMDRVASIARKAVEAGEGQALLFQFPSAWLPDEGRSITSHAADWHEHLVGLAKRPYVYVERNLKRHGFKLDARILDCSNGMPGDVGFFPTMEERGLDLSRGTEGKAARPRQCGQPRGGPREASPPVPPAGPTSWS